MQTTIALLFVFICTGYLAQQIWRFLRSGGESKCSKCHLANPQNEPAGKLHKIETPNPRD